MATFKVGQRVRVLYCRDASLIGREGVIVSHTPFVAGFKWKAEWDVEIPGAPVWCFATECLAPLTDPKADEFIERIKKLAREPVTGFVPISFYDMPLTPEQLDSYRGGSQ